MHEPHPNAPSKWRKQSERVVRCAVCDPTGKGRNCARLACYCGHPECWAYKTYRAPKRAPIKGYENTARIRESWNNREEPTWLDR